MLIDRVLLKFKAPKNMIKVIQTKNKRPMQYE